DALATRADDVMRLGGDDPTARLKALGGMRHGVETLFRMAAGDNNAVDSCLIKGDFEGAAAALIPRRPTPETVAAPAAAQVEPEPLPRPNSALPAAQALTILPRLILPPQLDVGIVAPAVLDW